MRGLRYVISNITHRKFSTLILITILVISLTLLTSISYYTFYAREILLEKHASNRFADGYINVYQSQANLYNVSLPPSSVTRYIEENISIIKNYGILYSLYCNVVSPMEPLISMATIYFADDSFLNFSIRELISSSVSLTNLHENEILINTHLLEEFDLNYDLVGSTVTIYLVLDNQTYSANFTIAGTFHINTMSETSYIYLYFSFFGLENALKYLLANGNSTLLNSNSTSIENLIKKLDYTIFFKFDESAFYGLDPYSAYLKAVRTANKIEAYFSPFVSVSVFSTFSVTTASEYLLQYLSFLSMFLIPVTVLSWVVLKFVFDSSAVRRRKEISILKSRGFTNRELIVLSLIELGLYSVIVSVLSIIFGNFVAYYFIVTNISANATLSSMIISAFIQRYDFFIVFLISFIILFVAYFGTLAYSISAEAAEVRQYYVREFEEIRLSSFEYIVFVILFIFGSPGFFLLRSLNIALTLFSPIPLYILLSTIVIVFIGYFLYIAIKIALLVLVWVKTRFVQMITRVKESFASKLISRYLIYRKRSEGFAILAIFLSILIAFSSISFIVISNNYLHDVSYYYVGSDISFKFPGSAIENISQVKQAISSLSGVSGVSVVYIGRGTAFVHSYYGIYQQPCTIFAIDQNFPNVAYIENYFLEKEYIETVVSSESTAVVSFSLYNKQYPSLTVRINYNTSYYERKNFSVISSTDYIPGVVPQFLPSSFVVISVSNVKSNLKTFTTSAFFLIKVSENSNIQELRKNIIEIASMYTSKSIELKVAKELYSSLINATENRIIFGSLFLVLGVSLFFMIVGQVILYLDKFEKVKKDLIILKTLGAGSKELSKLIYLDTVLNSSISILFGIVMSVLFVLTYLNGVPQILYLGEITETASLLFPLPVEFIIPADLWSIFLLIFVSFLAIANVPIVRRITKMNIAREIKYEYG